MGNLGELAESDSRLTLTSRGREFVGAFWEFAAFLANSFVFLLIGVALAQVHARSFVALAIEIALALVGRAAAVYPLAALFSRSRWRIPLREQHFLWWAGLRGALALALALALPLRHALPRRDSRRGVRRGRILLARARADGRPRAQNARPRPMSEAGRPHPSLSRGARL